MTFQQTTPRPLRLHLLWPSSPHIDCPAGSPAAASITARQSLSHECVHHLPGTVDHHHNQWSRTVLRSAARRRDHQVRSADHPGPSPQPRRMSPIIPVRSRSRLRPGPRVPVSLREPAGPLSRAGPGLGRRRSSDRELRGSLVASFKSCRNVRQGRMLSSRDRCSAAIRG